MDQVLRELEKLGNEIKLAEEDVSREEGKLTVFHETLKKEFEVETVSEAEKLLESLTEELESVRKQALEKFSALQEKYEW